MSNWFTRAFPNLVSRGQWADPDFPGTPALYAADAARKAAAVAVRSPPPHANVDANGVKPSTYNNRTSHGLESPKLHCPHCAQSGYVHTKSINPKAGISGGKAVAGLLTGGVSLLATGLSRHQRLTEAWCRNCKSTWHF